LGQAGVLAEVADSVAAADAADSVAADAAAVAAAGGVNDGQL